MTAGIEWLFPGRRPQEYDATLTALAGLNSTAGLVAQTGADAFTKVSWAASSYTPTLTGVLNVDATTSYAANYARIGNVVVQSGTLAVDHTTSGARTQVGLSLAVASAFTTTIPLRGGGFVLTGASVTPVQIYADATNDRAQLDYYAPSAGNDNISYIFLYGII